MCPPVRLCGCMLLIPHCKNLDMDFPFGRSIGSSCAQVAVENLTNRSEEAVKRQLNARLFL